MPCILWRRVPGVPRLTLHLIYGYFGVHLFLFIFLFYFLLKSTPTFQPFTHCIFYVLFIYLFAILQCTCPSVDSVQLIFTPRSAPNDGGNLHERNRTVERYNVGQIQYFENGYVTNLNIIIDVDTGNCCVACHRFFFSEQTDGGQGYVYGV